MFRTRITELFGIEYPVIGGCMQWITGPEFTAAVCEAGALGIMSSAMFPTQEEFRAALRRLKGLTDRPFAVNLNLFPALRPIDNRLYAEVILEEGGVTAVEFSGNRPPEDLVAMLREGGLRLMHKCVSVRHALSAQKAGVDAVTLFGYEGGGHIGPVATLSLVPRAVDVLDIPVIAAGGIVDGRGMLAALSLGAEGVLIGTRLLLTRECPMSAAVKESLLAAGEEDTVPLLGSVHNTIRVLRNRAAERAAELEREGADFQEILAIVAGSNTRGMLERGEVDLGVLACSQSVGVLHDIVTVKEAIQNMVAQAEEAAGRLARLLSS
ncbi:MAG: nitronate monooxygenase [Actinobacteria bacterium]|nr:nitronate monooxygenase [Actinomycetota bacterium]MDI6830566.1 nitronate monooxygenase family protein [Actinomycetota bacterium]